jgi:hypothetical protein
MGSRICYDAEMEQIVGWLPLIGYFIVTGLFMEAMNLTTYAKAGDPGFKGVWYVWRRVFLLPIGAILGVGGFFLGLPNNPVFGTEIGGAVLEGVLGAGAAGLFFDMIVNTVRARIAHKAAKE